MTFGEAIGEVALIPGVAGVFIVRVNATEVFNRATVGGFPEAKELKQAVRDVIAPGRSLGHSDRE